VEHILHVLVNLFPPGT